MFLHATEYYLGFLPLVFVTFWIVATTGSRSAAKAFLVAISLYFYQRLDAQFFALILVSTVANFLVAVALSRQQFRGRRALYWGAIVLNVFLLAHFKYTQHFLAELARSGWVNLSFKALALPVGLSFLTVQQVGALTDFYGRVVKVGWRDGLDFALFSTFFPKVISGPILRYRDFSTQLKDETWPRFDIDRTAMAVCLFMMGLAKKTVVADQLLALHTQGISAFAQLNALESWVLAAIYTLQVYFDFSGYTDMAIGSGLLLGLKLPANFATPLATTNIIGYWQRWHMSLTRFLTTYVFSGFLRLVKRTDFPALVAGTLLTMFVSGIWHGASLTFLVFGLVHGFALVLNHAWRKRALPMPKLLGWTLTFAFLCSVNVLFFAGTLPEAAKVLSRMFGLDGMPTIRNGLAHLGLAFAGSVESVALVAAAFALAIFGPTAEELSQRLFKNWVPATAVLAGLIYLVVLFGKLDAYQYVYFRF